MAFREANYQQLNALSKCRLGEMKAVIDLLEAELADATASLVKADDMARVYRLQGKASVLKDLVEAINASPEQLARLHAAKR